MKKIKSIVKSYLPFVQNVYSIFKNKSSVELNFWKNQIKLYQEWYDGKIPDLFGEKIPLAEQKVVLQNKKDSAILTWLKIHQEKKYLEDLVLTKNYFNGMKVLDIGSGPFPSAQVFENTELYCLDPLLPDYFRVGFPSHYFDHVKFVCSTSEDMPFENDFFDAVISVNAIDHVDDFLKTIQEIRRVLKKNGKLRMHIHYHKKTPAEPIELNDKIVSEAFVWCPNFKKISESKNKRGFTLDGADEMYTVWSN